MAKKTIGIVLLLVAVAFFGVYAYKTFYVQKIPSIDDIIPGNVVYYFYSYDLGAKAEEFQSSPIFQKISGLALYQQNIAPKLKESTDSFPFLTSLLKKDVALAVYSFGDERQMGDILVATRLDTKEYPKIKKELAEFYLSRVAKEDITFTKYSGVKISAYDFPKERIVVNMALLGDVLLVSNSRGLIKESIDLFNKKSSNSLRNNDSFQAASKRIKKDALAWGYQDYAGSMRQMQEQLVSLKSQGRMAAQSARYNDAMMQPILELMSGFKENVFYLDYSDSKDSLVFKNYGICDRSKDKAGFIEAFFSGHSLNKAVFDLMPENVAACYAGNLNILNYWKFMNKFLLSMEEAMKQAGQPGMTGSLSLNDLLAQIDAFLGVSMEQDILPLLGENSGIVLINIEDIAISAPGAANAQSMSLPFPQIYGFCELKDRTKMQEVLRNVTQNLVNKANEQIRQQKERAGAIAPGQAGSSGVQAQSQEKDPLTLKEDNYSDAGIVYLELADLPVKIFQPNYAIVDDFLVCSLSLQTTKEIIDIYKGQKSSFASGLELKSIQQMSFPDNFNILFVDFRKLINDIRSLSVYDMLTGQAAMRGRKGVSKQEIDALMDVLSDILSFGAVSRMSDSETIESTSFIKVRGL